MGLGNEGDRGRDDRAEVRRARVGLTHRQRAGRAVESGRYMVESSRFLGHSTSIL
jgi:hypothetical protein